MKILSIGDSKHEKKATLNLCKLNYYEKINVKFIKSIRSASLRSIILQLNFIQENFIKLIENENVVQRINIEMKGKKIFIKCNKDDKEEDIQDYNLFNQTLQTNKKFLNKKRVFDY